MITGHRQVVAILERDLPPVTLLLGPPSIGKQTLALHLAGHHRIGVHDQFHHPGALTIDAARTVIRFVSRAPVSLFKLVILDLDQASNPALNALLKTLEEPPASARFILTASAPTLPTIASRAQVFRLGTLHDTELVDILVGQGVPTRKAGHAARLGHGQVAAALAVDTDDHTRDRVLALAKALACGDHTGFAQVFQRWDESEGALLLVWLREAITGKWLTFSQADTFGLRRDQLRRMLLACSQFSAARSRLGVRAALEPFLSR